MKVDSVGHEIANLDALRIVVFVLGDIDVTAMQPQARNISFLRAQCFLNFFKTCSFWGCFCVERTPLEHDLHECNTSFYHETLTRFTPCTIETEPPQSNHGSDDVFTYPCTQPKAPFISQNVKLPRHRELPAPPGVTQHAWTLVSKTFFTGNCAL